MSDVTGFSTQNTFAGEFNADDYHIEAKLAKLSTAIPVEVVAQRAGGLAPVGVVDIVPLVSQISGDGTVIPHGTITNVPYNRLQGGANAVIIDPAIGDIGIAVFSQRDMSSVKNARAAAPPGSQRMHHMSDAMYIGGILNGTPTQYIQFNSSGITVYSPTAINVEAPIINATATNEATVSAPTVSVTASVMAAVTAPVIQLGSVGKTLYGFINSLFEALYNGHTHPVTAVGSPTGVPTQQMSSTQITQTVTGS